MKMWKPPIEKKEVKMSEENKNKVSQEERIVQALEKLDERMSKVEENQADLMQSSAEFLKVEEVEMKATKLERLEREALDLQRKIRAKYPMVVPQPWPEELERWQSRLWELGYEIVREKERISVASQESPEIEQKGFERGLEGVASGFENNELIGKLEPIAQRIFKAIQSQGYDIVPQEKQAEEVGEAETEAIETELPIPPYLHII